MPTEPKLPDLQDGALLELLNQQVKNIPPEAELPSDLQDGEFLKLLADRPLALSAVAVDQNELAPEQRANLIMRDFRIDEEAFFAEEAEALGEIMKLVPSRAFKALDKLFEKHFSLKMKDYIAGTLLTQVPEGHPDFTIERAENFDHSLMKGIKAQSEEYTTWFKLWSDVCNFKNRVIAQYTESETGVENMHAAARVEYVHFGEIAEASNDLYLVWHNDCGKMLTTEQRKEHGFTNEIATTEINEDGQFAECPWIKAFPREVGAVIAAYRSTVRDLEALITDGTTDEDKRLIEAKTKYYEAIATAYEESSLDAFKKADTMLPGQNIGRTDMPVHIHSIEYGYGKDPIQRAPETHLRYPDADGAVINKMALDTRTDMIRELDKLLKEGDYTDGTTGTVNLVKVTTYLATHFLGSGFGLDFLAAGQILPNEEECRLNGGVSITVNKEGMSKRIDQFHEGMEAIFGTEIAEKYLPRGKVDLDKMSGYMIASHEFGHNVGLTADTLRRLGKSFVGTHIEEWKATTGGMVLAEWRTFNSLDQANEVTINTLRQSVIQHVGGAGRYAAGRASSHNQPYFRKSVMLMNAVEAEGLVVKDENGWNFDLTDEKVKAFYARLDAQYLQVLAIYDHGTKADLDAFLLENLKPAEFIEHIVDSIDKAYPEKVKGAPSLDKICELN